MGFSPQKTRYQDSLSSDLLFHHLFYALFNACRFSSAVPSPVDPRRHAGDDAHEVVHQIVIGVLGKEHLQPASLHGKQLLNVDKPKAGSPISVLQDNHANAWISQEFQELGAAVIQPGTNFWHHARYLIAMGSSVILQTFHLAFQVAFLLN